MIRDTIREALANPARTVAEAAVLAFTVLALLAGTVVLWAVMSR